MAAAVAAVNVITITTETAVVTNNCSRQRSGQHPGRMVLLLTLVVVGFCLTLGGAESTYLDTFATCLAQKNATMYGSFLCPHCDDQKKLFGSSFRLVPYVECSVRGTREMSFLCVAAQIRYTPTWIFADGERRIGLQTLKALSEKTGCRLP